MKKDQKQKIKDMSHNQLQKRLTEISNQITDNNMKLSVSSLKNVHANKELKKERALIKFILSQETESKSQIKETK